VAKIIGELSRVHGGGFARSCYNYSIPPLTLGAIESLIGRSQQLFFGSTVISARRHGPGLAEGERDIPEGQLIYLRRHACDIRVKMSA